jgi:hypothetical protein
MQPFVLSSVPTKLSMQQKRIWSLCRPIIKNLFFTPSPLPASHRLKTLTPNCKKQLEVLALTKLTAPVQGANP